MEGDSDKARAFDFVFSRRPGITRLLCMYEFTRHSPATIPYTRCWPGLSRILDGAYTFAGYWVGIDYRRPPLHPLLLIRYRIGGEARAFIPGILDTEEVRVSFFLEPPRGADGGKEVEVRDSIVDPGTHTISIPLCGRHWLPDYITRHQVPRVRRVEATYCLRLNNLFTSSHDDICIEADYNVEGDDPELAEEAGDWPLGPAAPRLVSYPLCREAWVMSSHDVDIPLTSITWTNVYGGEARNLLSSTREGRLSCRNIEVPGQRRVLVCNTLTTRQGEYLGPFTVLIGSKPRWRPGHVARLLGEIVDKDAWETAVLPLGILRDKPGIVLPLSFAGPIGIQYYRGWGLRIEEKWRFSYLLYHDPEKLGGAERAARLQDESILILDPFLHGLVREAGKRLYMGDYEPTLWTVFETVKGPRPGPPLRVFEEIGFDHGAR